MAYRSPVPLFDSDAAAHGRARLADPGPDARNAQTYVIRKRARKEDRHG